MNFFFDENIPPALSGAVRLLGYEKFNPGQVGEVVFARDKFKAGTTDIEWLTALGGDRGSRWTIISRDGFRKQKGTERQVQRQYGLSVFVLQRSWASKQYWDMAAQFVRW